VAGTWDIWLWRASGRNGLEGGLRKMKPEECPKLDECYKVKMILDKDMLDFQYAECIREVCTGCPGPAATDVEGR